MKEKQALENIVTAWEAIPSGNLRPREVEQWLRDYMWHAVNDAREALGKRRTDDAPLRLQA